VSVLLGNGDGTFRANVDYPTGRFAVAVAVVDVSGDGNPDLVVANQDANSLSVLLGNGDGTFQMRFDYLTGSTDPGAVSMRAALAVADVNGDGKPDLVETNSTRFGDTVSVLLGNGDGTFRARMDRRLAAKAYSVALADVSGDGKLDLVTANGIANTVSVLLGNGDGTFQSDAAFGTAGFPYSIAVADLNGDGKGDLVVTNLATSTVSVLVATCLP
jgi:hypothetical protein